MMLTTSFIAVCVMAAPNPSVSKGAARDSKSATGKPGPAAAPSPPALAAALRALASGSESALANLEKIAAARPKDPRVLFALGTAYKLAGKSEPALRAYRAAAEVSKKEDGVHAARPWYGLARLYRDAGLEKQAAAALKSFVWRARDVKALEAVVRRVDEEMKKAAAPTTPPVSPRR